MYISRIYIKNYRNFKEFDLFIPNGNPLTIIGGNNVGKTNLLNAIRLVLDSQMPPWDKQLSENDFCWELGKEPWKSGEEIVITLTLSGIKVGEESNEFLQSLTSVSLDEDTNNIEETFNANLSFVFAPEYKKKNFYNIHDDYKSFLVAGMYHPSGFEYNEKGELRELSGNYKEAYAGICNSEMTDFYKYFYINSSDLEKLINLESSDEGIEIRIYKQLYASKIKKRINLLYLDALRDVAKNFYEGYHSVVSQLLRFKIDLDNNKDSVFYNELTDGFSKLRNDELVKADGGGVIPMSKKVMDDTQSVLQSQDLNLLYKKANLLIGTPNINSKNIGGYFNFLVDLLEESHSPENVSVTKLGLGYQNLAYISSVFAIFELKKRINNPENEEENKIFFNILLTEEPEAHLDVQNQKHLHTQIEKKTQQLQKKTMTDGAEIMTNTFTQVIQTSHSTHLTSKANLENIVILQKINGNTSAINIDKALNNGDIKKYQHNKRIIHQYLDATRSSLLFARKVILVEGASEKFSMPTLLDYYLKTRNENADMLGIEVVEVGFKGFNSFYALFGQEQKKLHNKCLGFADGDWQLDTTEQTIFELPIRLNNFVDEQTNVVERKNIYTYEIDLFIIPNPDNLEENNIEWLKLILTKFKEEGKYYKDQETFDNKIKFIDDFRANLIKVKVGNDKDEKFSVKNFFAEILYNKDGGEVTKPTISLYLSSLLKSKHLDDDLEKCNWDTYQIDQLKPFIIPKFIQDGLDWLINSNESDE